MSEVDSVLPTALSTTAGIVDSSKLLYELAGMMAGVGPLGWLRR